ncbi:MAG: DUF4157 domain-containing protein, partial [Bacteroidota bacterium]
MDTSLTKSLPSQLHQRSSDVESESVWRNIQESQSSFFSQSGKGETFFQTKLHIHPGNDIYEREADAIADKVISTQKGEGSESTLQKQSQEDILQTKPLINEISRIGQMSSPLFQSKPAFDPPLEKDQNAASGGEIQSKAQDTDLQRQEESEEELQAKGEPLPPSKDFERNLQNSKGRGQALPEPTQNRMEQGFGTNFVDVRVHTGKDANTMSESVGAQAFTHGHDIYFNEGKYQPGTREGDHLLAHELTHTVQQTGGHRQAIQKKAQTSVPVPQEVVSLSQPFTPSATLVAHISQQKKGAEIRVKYKNFASGTLKVRQRKDGTYDSTTKGYHLLPLYLPWSTPLNVAGVKSYLAVRIRKNEVTGYADFTTKEAKIGWGGSHTQRIKKLLDKHKSTMGWVGMDKFRFPKVENSLENGVLTLGLKKVKVRFGGFVDANFDFLAQDDRLTINGTGTVNIPMLQTARVKFSRDARGNIRGGAKLGVLIGSFSGHVDAAFLNGLVDVKGEVAYRTEKLSGKIYLLVTDAQKARQIAIQQLPPTQILMDAQASSGMGNPNPEIQPGPRAIAGYGELDFAFNDWIVGKARVIVDNKGHVTVQGEITPPATLVLFQGKPFGPHTFFKINPKFRWGIPYIADVHVGLSVHVYAEAGIGPALLKDIKVSGTYSTDPAIFNDFRLEGTLSMQAFAELSLKFGASVGVGILGFDIDGKGTITGKLGARGYVEATPVIGYREKADPTQGKKGEFFLKGSGELAVQPYLGLSGGFGVYIDSPWPIPNKNWYWPMFQKEYPLPGEFGIGMKMEEYVLGSGKWPKIDWGNVKFDRDKFMDDAIERRIPNTSSGKPEPKSKFKDNLKGQKPSPPPTMTFAAERTGSSKEDPKKKMKGIPEPKLRKNWIKAMRELRALKRSSSDQPLTVESITRKLEAIQKKYNLQKITVQDQTQVWVVTAIMNSELHSKNNPIGIKVEAGSTTRDPKSQEQVSKALKSIPAKEKSKLINGNLSKVVAHEVAAEIKQEYPVFKVFKVLDGKDSWDYFYVASPGEVYGDDEQRPGKWEQSPHFHEISNLKKGNYIKELASGSLFSIISIPPLTADAVIRADKILPGNVRRRSKFDFNVSEFPAVWRKATED